MLDLFSVLVPIALVDSTSITPLSLVPLTTMLSGRRPLLTAWSFLLGLFISYMIMALAFLLGLSAVLGRLNAWLEYRWNNPGTWDFGFQVLVGIILLVFGIRIAEKRREKTGGRQAEAGMSPWAAFGFGFMLNVVGFPGAVPYFAAADRINQAGLGVFDQVVAVAFYVTVFLLPLMGLLLLRAFMGRRMLPLLATIKGFFDTWGRRIMILLLILLGVSLVLDGIAFFAFGDPIVPIGWPSGSA
jgi:cytochrome c biogenesis protein CcdA